ncbi:MAG TPA: hypothetical protein PKH10_06615 [bacterium]|nr:hypothetical protein [bacterium]
MHRITVLIMVLGLTASLFAAAPSAIKKAQVRYDRGTPVMVTGLQVPLKADAATVEKFVKNEFFPAFKLGKDISLVPFRTVTIDGTAIFKYGHAYKGWPVEGAYTTVSVKNGKAYRVNNGLGAIDLDLSNLVSPDKAVRAAMAKRFAKQPAALPKHLAEKVIINIGGAYLPAYRFSFMPSSLADNRYYYVNAKTGAFIKMHDRVMYADDDTLLSDDPMTALDLAKVFTKNPISTPDLVEVELPWVAPADDADLAAEARGFLTAKKDSSDIRKIKAFNCPNKDEKLNLEPIVGYAIMLPICTPTQLANKVSNGSFIYDDCKGDQTFVEANMREDKIDKCAEISMYYHASKIYQYIRQLDTGFEYLSGNKADAPLNVIGNFQMVDMNDLGAIIGGTAKLAAMDNAFFSPDNPMIAQFFETYGIKGDLLVFGQGSFADFGLDGDVVYHEFGHATVYTTGLDSGAFLDKYGMNGEPGALHEGFGDTFSFIISDDPCTGEYASDGIVKWANSQGGFVEMDKYDDGEKEYWCMRYAEHEYKVIEDWEGEVHWDGQPHLAANWAIYKLAQKDQIGGTTLEEQKAAFTKLLLKTLYALGTSIATHELWADTLLSEIDNDDAYKTHKAHIEQILTDFNYFTEIRARDGSKTIERLFQDAAVDPEGGSSPLGGGGTSIQITEGEEQIPIAPGYLQIYYTVPEDFEFSALRVTATVAASGGSDPMGGTSEPDLHVWARKTDPIEYTIESSSSSVVLVSAKYDADIEKDTAKNGWYLTGVEPGEKYYLQFVNFGFGGATVTSIAIAGENYVPATDEDVIGADEDTIAATDEEEVDTVVVPDTGTVTKKDDGCGCSLVF